MKTAILVDGGYYRRLARHYAGEKSPQERANELEAYCRKHLRNRDSYTLDEKSKSIINIRIYTGFFIMTASQFPKRFIIRF